MTKFKTSLFAIFTILLITSSCAELNQVINTGTGVMQPTQGEVSSGLKEALVQGISKGVLNASKLDGFNANSLIKIPFPPDAIKVANTLRDIGLGKEVDKFVTTLNRGAEDAATAAKPIFVNAIKSLTIQDAFAILRAIQLD